MKRMLSVIMLALVCLTGCSENEETNELVNKTVGEAVTLVKASNELTSTLFELVKSIELTEDQKVKVVEMMNANEVPQDIQVLVGQLMDKQYAQFAKEVAQSGTVRDNLSKTMTVFGDILQNLAQEQEEPTKTATLKVAEQLQSLGSK